jgi:hypothetical protein
VISIPLANKSVDKRILNDPLLNFHIISFLSAISRPPWMNSTGISFYLRVIPALSHLSFELK